MKSFLFGIIFSLTLFSCAAPVDDPTRNHPTEITNGLPEGVIHVLDTNDTLSRVTTRVFIDPE